MISAADIRPLWGEVELISLIFYSRLVFADIQPLLIEDFLVLSMSRQKRSSAIMILTNAWSKMAKRGKN